MVEQKIKLKEIIENCKLGNCKSQRKLYEHFYGYGMNIALRYAKNKEEAQEVLNDAFLKAFLKLNTFDNSFAFQPWLRKIIVNTSIDYYRSKRGFLLYVELSAIQELSDDPFPLPKLSPDEDVLPIIQQLPPAYRLVFNLYVMEGYKHQEISKMLGIKVSTSKSNLSRAKVKLRELFQKQEVNEIILR